MERSFRNRAASILHSSSGPTGPPGQTNSARGRNLSGATDTPDNEPFATEKRQSDGGLGLLDRSPSLSSNDKTVATSGENAAAQDRDAQRAVRTIPSKALLQLLPARRNDPIELYVCGELEYLADFILLYSLGASAGGR